MYRELRQYFQWNNMKMEVVKYVDKCLTCQKVKAEHQRPEGEWQPLEIPTWKWVQSQWTWLWVYPFLPQRRMLSESTYQVGPFSTNQGYLGS